MNLSASEAERAALAVAARTLATEAGYDEDSGVVKDAFNEAVSGLLEAGLISDSTAIQVAGDVEEPLAGNARVSVRDVEGAPTDNTARGDDDGDGSGFPALGANERAQELGDGDGGADADPGPDPGPATAGGRAGAPGGFPALSASERLAETEAGGRRE